MKVECFAAASFSSLVECNTLAYWAYSLVTTKVKFCEYDSWGCIDKHFIFFITYKRAKTLKCFSLGILSSLV